jgi:raffinose/stachyose/melibiose transport system substrate-binding protein
MSIRRRGALVVTATVLATVVAGGAATVAQDPVTVDVYDLHIPPGPQRTYLDQVAVDYEAEHPGVDINWVVLENEALKDKIAADMAADAPPDLFQSWGGGVLAEQVAAGMAQPIDDAFAEVAATLSAGASSLFNVDGVQYGLPYNSSLVGLWYNKDLFAQAGITELPATWEDFLADVQKLKEAGITPISVGGSGHEWTEMFWWAYLALRIGGQEALTQAIATGDWTGEAFVQAGEQLKRLIDLQPFQDGWGAATHNEQQGTFGNAKAAMELQGQWALGAQKDQSESGEGIGDALAWFPFPTVEGGAGSADVFGGGDGFVVGRDAPPEAVDFLKYLVSPDVANGWAGLNDGILPATLGSEEYVSDPNLKTIASAVAAAPYAQLFLDQVTPPAVGEVINESVSGLFQGVLTPADVAQAITDAAATAAG